MMLADQGAEVIRVEPVGGRIFIDGETTTPQKFQVLNRNRKSVMVNLKSAPGREAFLKLVDTADALIEGFRPGVMEKLGIGPKECLARNPKLVFGRITGWGQDGPYAKAAGHDLNYIALSGALSTIGPKGQKPVVPINVVGDFGGGGMLMAFGVCAALLSARATGKGQVIDAAMVDGSAALIAGPYGSYADGSWTTQRGTNLLDGGAHFYDTYETKDGKWVSIGSIEPKFYALLLKLSGLEKMESLHAQLQFETSLWPQNKVIIEKVFKTKTRDEWCKLMETTDVCFAPVLDMAEAPKHPHNVHRNSFVTVEGVTQPSPAPRFLGTPASSPLVPPEVGAHTLEVFESLGFSKSELKEMVASGAIAVPTKAKAKL